MTQCADCVVDGIWIGKELPIDCVNEANCKLNGCYWRRFHQLAPDAYLRLNQLKFLGLQVEIDLTIPAGEFEIRQRG